MFKIAYCHLLCEYNHLTLISKQDVDIERVDIFHHNSYKKMMSSISPCYGTPITFYKGGESNKTYIPHLLTLL